MTNPLRRVPTLLVLLVYHDLLISYIYSYIFIPMASYLFYFYHDGPVM